MDNLQEIQTPSKSKQFPSVIVIAVLIVFTFLITVSYWSEEKRNKNLSTVPPISQKLSGPKYPTKQLTLDELKKLLPTGISLGQGALVLQSFSIKDSEGTEQITYQFITKKTLTENFNLYKTYLERNEWKIQNTINEADIKSLSAVKETKKKNINITISNNTLSGQNIVDISLISRSPFSPALMTELQEKSLLAKATLVFPILSEKVIMSESELPVAFQNFIKESGTINVEIQKLTYTNGQTGFSITGIIPNITLLDTELKFASVANKNQWERIKSVRAEYFAFVEYKDKNYEIRISYRLKQNGIEVNLQSIKR